MLIFFFFSFSFSPVSLVCKKVEAARPVTAASQDPFPRHVTRTDGVSVSRVWAETGVTDAVVGIMVSTAAAAQVNSLIVGVASDG